MKARIVTDMYVGYEVQVKRWYFPFWIQYKINSFPSIEEAEIYAKQILENKKVVKYL